MSSYGVKAHGSSKRRQQQIHLKRRTVPQVIHKCYSSLVASYSHVARKGVLCLCIAFHGKHRCRSMVLLVSRFKICTKKQCGPQVASFHAFEVLNLMAIDLPKLWQPAKNVDLVSGKLPWAVCGGGMPNTQWFIYIYIYRLQFWWVYLVLGCAVGYHRVLRLVIFPSFSFRIKLHQFCWAQNQSPDVQVALRFALPTHKGFSFLTWKLKAECCQRILPCRLCQKTQRELTSLVSWPHTAHNQMNSSMIFKRT